MSKPAPSRRDLLKGLGITMALPWLESLSGFSGAARGAQPAGNVTLPVSAAAAPDKIPNRMIFLYAPNGMVMQKWLPEGEGRDYTLSPTLQPLKDFKDDFNVITGLTAASADAKDDGAGDHARAMAAYLTGSRPLKTAGTPPVRAGVSVDQVAAQNLAKTTRFPSLEIGTEPTAPPGILDSGYSGLYTSTISWSSPETARPKMHLPQKIFDHLFRPNLGEGAQQDRSRSVVDFALAEAQRLGNRLSAADRQALDAYHSSIREMEKRLQQSASRPATLPQVNADEALPTTFAEHVQMLCDLVVLAIQADSTRIITCVLANERTNRTYPEIGVADAHHVTSHHGNKANLVETLSKIDAHYAAQFAYFLGKLKAVKEGDGTLLDHCMVAYGAGIADGNRHTHWNLPTILAGKGGGTIATGRLIAYPRYTPICNLWLSMLYRMDVRAGSFGDSTGRLTELKG
jgi:hypothetical protein